MTLLDVHQHIWTEPLLARLAAREAPPLVRRTNGLTMLHSAAEQPYVIDVAAEAPDRRASVVRAAGLDRALIAMSSPIGIEALPHDDARDLIDAHLDGVTGLTGEFGAWGPVALDQPDADDVESVLSRGCVGVSIPAGALAGPDRLELVAPILQRSAELQAPVFVHPGRAPGQRPGEVWLGEPLWWRALTDYVTQMQAAWLTFASFGRREHPDLVLVFAMLAGCAPLHGERLGARGGPPIDLRDPRVFYDTSSYGAIPVTALAQLVGEEQLVYGSDHPVADSVSSGCDARLQANAAALLAASGASP